MNDSSGSTSWSYDIRGRASSETKVIPQGDGVSEQTFVTEYGYNSADQMTWMEYPDGEIVNYEYNARMLLESVSSLAGYYASSILYDDAGRITHLTRGNNVVDTAYNYNSWNVQGGRLESLKTTRLSDQTVMQNLGYGYDPAGNILSITDTQLGNQTQTFTYDELHRLKTASTSGGSSGTYNESYSYDGAIGTALQALGRIKTSQWSHAHRVSIHRAKEYRRHRLVFL